MCVYFVALLCAGWFALGEPMMHLNLHVTCSCILMRLYILIYPLFGTLRIVSLSFFLSLPLTLVASWHLSISLFRPGILFVLGHHLLILLLSMSGSMMRTPISTSRRTSPNVVFIRNAMSYYQTSPIPLFRLSYIGGVRNLYVRYPWVVPPWSYRGSTPICMVSILLYHSLLLLYEVHI